MLYFLIPFKSRQVASDWGKTCRLLEQTLRSVRNQTNPRFKVCVICHEHPEIAFTHSAVTYYPAPFDPPPLAEDGSVIGGFTSLHVDKGRKCIFGLSVARQAQADYVMFLDADDLVSARICAFVHDSAHPYGWVFDRGYRMDECLPQIVYPRRRFEQECGSSHILKTELAPFPDSPDYTVGWDDYYIRRYPVHAYIAQNMRNLGYPLSTLPFPGAIYLFNDQSIFSSKLRPRDSFVRNMGRILLKARPVTQKMKREFGLLNT